jgi:hypothetical protein
VCVLLIALHYASSGGSNTRGLNSGAFTTFWNLWGIGVGINGQEFQKKQNFGPWLNFVGKLSNMPTSISDPVGRTWYMESVDFSSSTNKAKDLYLAQRSVRLAQATKVAAVLGGKGKGGALPGALPQPLLANRKLKQ